MSDSLRELQRHLRDFENQFDNAQGNLRTAGSLWTLAGIGGIGGAAAIDAPTMFTALGVSGVTTAALISLVCCLAILGLWNLWSLDQFVYQRLLHSVFAFGMELENFLEPHERLRQAVYGRVNDLTNRLSYFYALPILVFGIIFLLSNIAQTATGSGPVSWALWILLVLCLYMSIRLWDRSQVDDVEAAKAAIATKIAAMRAARRLPGPFVNP